MMNMIKSNPKYAAVFFFIITWAMFPVAAFLKSIIYGISFGAAASSPYMIAIFSGASCIAAIEMYKRAKMKKII